ncbi:MAG: YIP1 family protein [Candidatus Thorarchaeota archaeon]|nr:MAG: YIP1 family protein [Candidatus Thorarchaeota archaeon]
MVRRCEFCDSPVSADATTCPVCREDIAEETLERILPLLKRPEAKEVRFMGIFGRLWGVIRRPSATYRDIGQRPEAAGPFIIILVNAAIIAGLFLSLSSKVTTVVVVNATSGATAPANVLVSPQGSYFVMLALIGMLPSIMMGIIYLIIGTAFAHFAFKLAGGAGGKMKTLSIIGYSILPVVLLRLVSIIIIIVVVPYYPTIIDFSQGGSLPYLTQDFVTFAYTSDAWFMIDIVTTAGFLWTGLLLIFGIREAHDTSTIWAVFVSIVCTTILILTFWQIH